MNPGPSLTIRKTFPTLPRVLLFLVIIKPENIKISFTFCSYIKTQKHLYLQHQFTSVIYFFILFYLLYLFQNLVLDNHSVELGTRDKEFVLQVA
jgi:hypothetical protein